MAGTLTLSIESSAKAASCALTDGEKLLGQSFQNNGLTHSVTLLPMAEAMLKNLGLTLRDVGKIAVANGPGSFTGIRIGVASAKGLAFGLDIPVCGVPTLEAMAWQGVFFGLSLICCAMDARRGQVYNALFAVENGKPQRLCPDRAIAAAELKAEIDALYPERKILLMGDGALLCSETLTDAFLPPEPLRLQSAWGVAMAAADARVTDCHGLNPVYLRPSQAERERLNK